MGGVGRAHGSDRGEYSVSGSDRHLRSYLPFVISRGGGSVVVLTEFLKPPPSLMEMSSGSLGPCEAPRVRAVAVTCSWHRLTRSGSVLTDLPCRGIADAGS